MATKSIPNVDLTEDTEGAIADLRHVLGNVLEMHAGDDKSRRRLAHANVLTIERAQRTLADLHNEFDVIRESGKSSNMATETVNENDLNGAADTKLLEISPGEIVTVTELRAALEFIQMRRLFPSAAP